MILKRILVWAISLWFHDSSTLRLFLYNGTIFDGVHMLENCLLVIDALNHFAWGTLIEGIIFFSICWKISSGPGGLDGLIILNWSSMPLSVEDPVFTRYYEFWSQFLIFLHSVYLSQHFYKYCVTTTFTGFYYSGFSMLLV